MWSIIKSHFHKGKTGFFITGLFVVLSIMMMIIGLSICLGMDTLYVNTQKITNSPDLVLMNFNNNYVFDNFMEEILDKYSDNVEKVNRFNSIEYDYSSESLTNYFDFRFESGGNLAMTSFRMFNVEDKSNEFIPRIRNNIEKEGFKIYVPGNLIETSNIKVGTNTYFVYKGQQYKGYVAGIYDSMPMIYWTQNYYVDGEFYKLLENFMQTDKDFQYDNNYNIQFKYKNEKECDKIINNFSSELLRKINDFNLLHTIDKENKIGYGLADKFMFINSTKSFIFILGAALIAFSVLIAFITALAVAFLVRSSIFDEVRNLGVFKSLGYTTMMLRLSYLAIYGVIAGVCMFVGIILGISLMPTFVNVITAMARLDCTKAIGFNVGSIFVAIVFIVLVISVVVMLATRRIKRITPLSAMRNNFETHSFKKNLAPLSKSKVPVNAALGVKSVVGERGRSIMVVAIVLIMSLLSSFVSVVYFNLKVDQTAIINMSAMEVPDWCIGFDYENKDPYYEAIRQMDGYKYDTWQSIGTGGYIGESYAMGYYYEDFEKLNTKMVYEGRNPKYANEILWEVSSAKERGYNIGDSVTIKFTPDSGEVFRECVIVGFYQSVLNQGDFMGTFELLSFYFNDDYAKENNIGRYFYFEKGKVPTSSQIYQHLMKTFNVDTINFRGFYTGRSLIEDTFLRTVETAADAVMAVFISITALVICLLLVMLIRLKLLREKRVYAIYKALGYTTPNIMTQIAVAMVILGLLGSLVGAIVGGLVTTPLLSLAGSIIGVGRFAFVIPWGYIVGIIFAIPLLIYIVSMLCAIPVKKIAPATLLRERG